MKKVSMLSAVLAAHAVAAPTVVRFDPAMPFDPVVDSIRLSDINLNAPDIVLSFFLNDPGGGSFVRYWYPQIIGEGWVPFEPGGFLVESNIGPGLTDDPVDGYSFEGLYDELDAGDFVSSSSPGPWGVAQADVFLGAGPGNYPLDTFLLEVLRSIDPTCLFCSHVPADPNDGIMSVSPGTTYIAIRWDDDGETHYGWVAFMVDIFPFPESCYRDDKLLGCDPADYINLLGFEFRYVAAGYETQPNTPIVIGGGLCRADMNFDAQLDYFDISSFINHFAQGDLAADYTGDGSLNFFDVSAFLNAFNSGCDF